MASYDELSGMIGPLKRAAIDAYMADEGFSPDLVNDGLYSYWGWLPNSYHRPDANGEGGGDIIGFGSSISFDGIRSRVDSAVSPWLDPTLPDGSGASGPLTTTRSAASTLGASGTGGGFEDDGVIERSSSTINLTVLTNISGAFTTPFLAKYHDEFLNIAHRIGVATAMLEMNYSVQSQIWTAAGDDVASICESAKDSLASYAETTAQEMLEYGLTVVTVAAGAVASIATAGAAAPLVAGMVTLAGTATIAIQAIDAVATLSGSSYSELMESFEAALEAVNSAISTQETELVTMMNGATAQISENSASFDLDLVRFGDPEGTSEMIDIQQYRADTVSQNMQNVIDSLTAAQASLGSAPASNPTPRNGAIGAGASGTHTAASSLHQLTADCLASTIQEYTLGRELFNATIAAYFADDQATKSDLDRISGSEALSDLMGGS
ncbi:hypothetical protein AB0O14_08445 [Microbacterium foliorum]